MTRLPLAHQCSIAIPDNRQRRWNAVPAKNIRLAATYKNLDAAARTEAVACHCAQTKRETGDADLPLDYFELI